MKLDLGVATDLVCRIEVADEKLRYFSDYMGHVYPFCSAECKRKFDDHPDYFVQEEAKRALGLEAEKE